MTNTHLLRYGNDILSLIKLSKITTEELEQALENPFNSYYIYKKDKEHKRLIEEPNPIILFYQKVICKLLRQVNCPAYNYAGYEGQNAYLNAKAHVGQFAYITTDIVDYYLNSSDEKVLSVLTKDLGIRNNKYLEFLMKILTYNGHIPTGAPTSPILAFLCHKKLFDKIYEKMQAQNILFTLYADDLTYSAKHGMTNDIIYFSKDILAENGLNINAKKTKRYSYKKALITGFRVHQNGKITVPYNVGYSVIEKLKEKSINDMNASELRKLIGKINYNQFCDKKAFKATKIKACRRLGRLIKEQNERKNNYE